MFKNVFLSLCASVLVYGCSDTDSNIPTATVSEKINVVARNNADGERSTLPALRYNLENLSTPESIVVHGGKTYISNIGGNPEESAELGFISKFDGTSNVKLCNDIKLDDPKGFAFMKDDFVFISNHPQITLMKISATEECSIVQSLPVENGAGFLNDVVRLNDTTALVSDTGKGLIYKVTIKTDGTGFEIVTLSNLAVQAANGINGLAFDSTTKMLYFVTSTFGGDATKGDIYSVQLDDNLLIADGTELAKWNTEQIGAGGLDGLVLIDDNKKLILSDWGVNGADKASKLYIYDVVTKDLLTIISGDITSAADITVNNNLVYIPEFGKNKIVTVDISTVQ